MFWMGMIVGIIIAVIVTYGYIRLCMKVAGVSTDDFWNGVDALETAWVNRESELVVIHDDMVLNTYEFKVNE